MSLYPEDVAFEEETAGFENHPAALLYDTQIMDGCHMDPGEPIVMVEKMGVSDPECDKSDKPGELPTSNNSLLPDLVIHHGSQPVNEYNNADLLPGMYPTLFPCGVGGFEYPSRPTTISFQQQAKYCLQLADRSFRYHHSFMFVALNIIQHRQAHLKTYFTCKQSHFLNIARQLTQVSPQVLENLALRLEQECKQSEFTPEEKNAFSLLKHVKTISARIPGSEASLLHIQSFTRS
ncbi:hypothetical protein EDC04DRAFT_2645117 [Pisolithus marmoratus]|nr:hypothetical protein EDC04DRAFT_2645117 [Pisolithus marmoratus]